MSQVSPHQVWKLFQDFKGPQYFYPVFFDPIKSSGIDQSSIDKIMTTDERFKRIYNDYRTELDNIHFSVMEDLKKTKKQAQDQIVRAEKDLEEQKQIYELQKQGFFDRLTNNFTKLKHELTLKFQEKEEFFDSSLDMWKLKLMIQIWHLAGISKKNLGVDQMKKIISENPMIDLIEKKNQHIIRVLEQNEQRQEKQILDYSFSCAEKEKELEFMKTANEKQKKLYLRQINVLQVENQSLRQKQ